MPHPSQTGRHPYSLLWAAVRRSAVHPLNRFKGIPHIPQSPAGRRWLTPVSCNRSRRRPGPPGQRKHHSA